MLFDWSRLSPKSSALPSRCSRLFVCKHFQFYQLVVLDCLVSWSRSVDAFNIVLLALSAPWSASSLRRNLSTNRLHTRIWSSTRITLDHLTTTRSSTLGKLLALRLGNLRPSLPRIAMVGWSWCWRPKSYIGCVQATFFSHRYDGSSNGFVKCELQLSLYHHQIKKGVDLQIVSLTSFCS